LKKDEYIKRNPHYNFLGELVDADMQLEYLKDFADSTVNFLRHAARKSKKKKRELSDALMAIAGEEEYLYSELYASDVNQACIIACVIFLERQIKCFAHDLNVALQLGLGIRDLSGSLLERFRKYCENVARLHIDLDELMWLNIKGVVEIRNCLIHCSGNIDEFKKKSEIIEFEKRHRTPRIDGSWIRIEEKTVNVVIKTLREFVESIYKCALERFPKESDQIPAVDKERN